MVANMPKSMTVATIEVGSMTAIIGMKLYGC
jgi:hypothetical protein